MDDLNLELKFRMEYNSKAAINSKILKGKCTIRGCSLPKKCQIQFGSLFMFVSKTKLENPNQTRDSVKKRKENNFTFLKKDCFRLCIYLK